MQVSRESGACHARGAVTSPVVGERVKHSSVRPALLSNIILQNNRNYINTLTILK